MQRLSFAYAYTVSVDIGPYLLDVRFRSFAADALSPSTDLLSALVQKRTNRSAAGLSSKRTSGALHRPTMAMLQIRRQLLSPLFQSL